MYLLLFFQLILIILEATSQKVANQIVCMVRQANITILLRWTLQI